jgi:hypothetical protein
VTIRPIYKTQDEFGRWIFGLHPPDLAKVEAGFACHQCLEEFEVAGIPVQLDKCNVCGASRQDHGAFVATPDGWNG